MAPRSGGVLPVLAGFVSCGSPFGGISIIQHGTRCTQARKVMQKVYVKSQEVAPVNGVLYARVGPAP